MRNTFHCEHDTCYVIYTGTSCPLCSASDEIKASEEEIGERDAKIAQLQDEIQTCDDEILERGEEIARLQDELKERRVTP